MKPFILSLLPGRTVPLLGFLSNGCCVSHVACLSQILLLLSLVKRGHLGFTVMCLSFLSLLIFLLSFLLHIQYSFCVLLTRKNQNMFEVTTRWNLALFLTSVSISCRSVSSLFLWYVCYWAVFLVLLEKELEAPCFSIWKWASPTALLASWVPMALSTWHPAATWGEEDAFPPDAF